MNRLVQRQQDHNVQTASGWDVFSEHRRRVTRLLLPDEQRESQRLCVLGAGNCNDFDLAELAAAYHELHVVDLDQLALQRGLERLPPDITSRIRQHGGCDLSGILDVLSRWTPGTPPSDNEVSATIAAALAAPLPLNAKFDTTASICLLSQIIHSVVLSLGENHPRFIDLMTAVRLRHLRLLAELTAPGGRAILITDVVSSESCPALIHAPQEEFRHWFVNSSSSATSSTASIPQ